MADVLYCVVDASGEVYTRDQAGSYAEVTASLGLDEEQCQEYRFDLVRRQLHEDRGSPSGEKAVRTYLASYVGTPERLMRFVEERPVPARVLTELLDARTRRLYLDACTNIEKAYTAACAATNDPCLASGCSIDQAGGEVCLQPLLNAGHDYYGACAAEWIKLFKNPQNRIEAWRRSGDD